MEGQGVVTCGRWIKRPENVNLVVLGKSFKRNSSKSTLEIFSFDPETASLSSTPLTVHVIEEGEPVSIAVHPSGDEIVCSTTSGDCKLFELCKRETDTKLLSKELACLQSVGVQKCIAFSVDGSRLASGGVDGHLRIFEWPSLRVVLDEPRAHKSFRDMDFRYPGGLPWNNGKVAPLCDLTVVPLCDPEVMRSYHGNNLFTLQGLDSEFLASTSTDGSARIWNANEGVPITNLRRNSDEKIELCRFSKDGTKAFLFCTVQRGDKAITGVWDMSTWDKIGHKRLLRKPASVMSISMDGKYLALGSKDGDLCVVEVKKMEIHHWSKRLHLGTSIASLEFCPTERVVLTTTPEWGALVTKLTVPKDWKEWQIYVVLLGLFVASVVLFYVFFLFSDPFWKLPVAKNQPERPKFDAGLSDSLASDDSTWGPFGPLDM